MDYPLTTVSAAMTDFRARAQAWARERGTVTADLFLVRAVQALVTAGAPSIHVVVRRSQVQLTSPASSERSCELKALFWDWPDDPSATLAHWRSAVWSALALRPRRLELQWQGMRAVWGAHGVTLQEADSADCEFVCDWGHPLFSLFTGGALAATIHAALYRRCALCPVPVFLDGRALNTGCPEGAVRCTPCRETDRRSGQLRWFAERIHFAAQDGRHIVIAPPIARPGRQYRVQGAGRSPGSPQRAVSLLSWLCWPALSLGSVRPPQANIPTRQALSARLYAEGADGIVCKEYEDAGYLLLGEPPLGGGLRSHLEGLGECRREGLKVPFQGYPLTPLGIRAYLGLRLYPDQVSQLYHWQDGVLLDPISLPDFLPGVVAILPWPGPLDASAPSEAEWQWILEETRALAEQMWPAAGRKDVYRRPRSAAEAWRKFEK